MSKAVLTEEESETLAEAVLDSVLGTLITPNAISIAAKALQEGLKKIMDERSKPADPFPYLISEDELRVMFEQQHQGRALQRGRKGTYQSPQIAAIWNQHFRTARLIEKLLRQKLQKVDCD